MHPTLLTALKDRTLSESAKGLLSYLYAHTNGDLKAAISIDGICDDLGIAEATVRRRRAELAEAGYLASDRAGDLLHFEIHTVRSTQSDDRRAVGARSDDDNAHLVRDERAPSARSDDDNAYLVRDERAPTARSEGNTDETFPPYPPLGIVNNNNNKTPLVATEGVAGGDRTEDLLRAAGVAPPIAAELAGRLSLQAAARHIAAWQIDRAVEPKIGVGALVSRLRNWDVPAELHTDDLTAGILADHITDQDLHAWRVKRKRKPGAEGYTVPPEYAHLVKH